MTATPNGRRLSRLRAALPGLGAESQEFQQEVAQNVRELCLSEGDFVAMEGQTCNEFPIVAEGQVRVYAMNESGREITLYHIGPSESCVLFASCILAGEPFPAFARAESSVTALALPAARVSEWTHRHDFWRRYI